LAIRHATIDIDVMDGNSGNTQDHSMEYVRHQLSGGTLRAAQQPDKLMRCTAMLTDSNKDSVIAQRQCLR
jgi:hypothetical protein